MSMAERKTMTRAVKNPVKRKLTRAEKKEIAAVIQAAKGDGKPRTAQQTIQKKNVVILKRLQRFLKSIFNFNGRSHLSSFSTSLISFAVAVTIRIPLSLIVSSNVSSCRRCVFFVSGFSKRNWSTDIS